MTTIRCPRCSQVLGKTDGQVVEIQHKGRTIRADSVSAIKCEKCGAVWHPQGG